MGNGKSTRSDWIDLTWTIRDLDFQTIEPFGHFEHSQSCVFESLLWRQCVGCTGTGQD